jgi:hypothetical protein
MTERKPTLAVFWGDTRELLSEFEKKGLLQDATLESISPDEVLVRDVKSMRPIVITSTDEPNLFCTLCKDEKIRRLYGKACTDFAVCGLKKKGDEKNGVSRKGS